MVDGTAIEEDRVKYFTDRIRLYELVGWDEFDAVLEDCETDTILRVSKRALRSPRWREVIPSC